MQAGFSGRVDELRDLHMDVVDNRYLVEGSFPAADISDAQCGIECQNVAPWRHAHRSLNLLKAKSIWGQINEVFVFLFGSESPGSAGIYSLRTFTLDNVPRETVIAFECLDDAVGYAELLASTMSHEPSVHGITPEQLAEFCMESGYSCQLEAAGSPMVPPGFNVRVTDWERSVHLRSGHYCVLPEEPFEMTPAGDLVRAAPDHEQSMAAPDHDHSLVAPDHDHSADVLPDATTMLALRAAAQSWPVDLCLEVPAAPRSPPQVETSGIEAARHALSSAPEHTDGGTHGEGPLDPDDMYDVLSAVVPMLASMSDDSDDSDEGPPPSIPGSILRPAVLESVTPYLEAQVAYYYNNWEELSKRTAPPPDRRVFGSPAELDFDAVRAQLEHNY